LCYGFTVSEFVKAEEIILPEIRFFDSRKTDSLRANSEELEKGPDQVSPLPCFAVLGSRFHRKRYTNHTYSLASALLDRRDD